MTQNPSLVDVVGMIAVGAAAAAVAVAAITRYVHERRDESAHARAARKSAWVSKHHPNASTADSDTAYAAFLIAVAESTDRGPSAHSTSHSHSYDHGSSHSHDYGSSYSDYGSGDGGSSSD